MRFINVLLTYLLTNIMSCPSNRRVVIFHFILWQTDKARFNVPPNIL